MIKAEAKQQFNLKDYTKVEIIKKWSEKPNEFNKGDQFYCDQEMADYLSGNNPLQMNVIQILEVIPEVETPKEQEPTVEKTKKKKIDKKSK